MSQKESKQGSNSIDWSWKANASLDAGTTIGSSPGPDDPEFAIDGELVALLAEVCLANTYSSYARGLDALNATYQWLDRMPKGRDESELSFTMQVATTS